MDTVYEDRLAIRETEMAEREAAIREREREALAFYHHVEAKATAEAAALAQARSRIVPGMTKEQVREVFAEVLLGDPEVDLAGLAHAARLDATFLRAAELAQRWATTSGALAQMRYKGTGPAYRNIPGVGIRYQLSVIEAYEASGR